MYSVVLWKIYIYSTFLFLYFIFLYIFILFLYMYVNRKEFHMFCRMCVVQCINYNVYTCTEIQRTIQKKKYLSYVNEWWWNCCGGGCFGDIYIYKKIIIEGWVKKNVFFCISFRYMFFVFLTIYVLKNTKKKKDLWY